MSEDTDAGDDDLVSVRTELERADFSGEWKSEENLECLSQCISGDDFDL